MDLKALIYQFVRTSGRPVSAGDVQTGLEKDGVDLKQYVDSRSSIPATIQKHLEALPGERVTKRERKGDSLTRPHGILPALKPNSVDWIPGAPPGKSLTGMQFQYEAPMRHRPEAFAAVTAIRGTPLPRGRPVDL